MPKSYDISIRLPGTNANVPFLFGATGGIQIGNALKEPSNPTQTDTLKVESLHHGAGRLLDTDPHMYRDTNGKMIGCDARQPGYILPGGALTLLSTIAMKDAANVATLQAYAAAFTEDDGDVVFAAGTQLIHIAVADDTVTEPNFIGVNLITNFDFETDTTGWTTGGTNTIAASTAQFKFGAKSLLCTYQDNDVLASYAIVLPAAASYDSGLWLYIPTNYDGTDLRVRFNSFAGAGGTAELDLSMTVRDAWVFQKFSADFIPVGGDLTGTWELYENGTNATAGRFVYIDDPAIYRGVGAYFTGSVFIWGRDAWLGVRELDGDTYAAYEYDSDKMVFDGSFKHSWAASTRNSLFWFKNLSGVNPQFRWTDRTDQDFDDIDDTADTGFVYGPFTLEIEKAQVTGAGSAGPYVIFATKGGTLWSFDSSEVFVPMTPFEDGGFIDQRFGGKLAFVGTWLMVPSLDGLKRFDPRNISMVDISPPVHQGSYASVGTNDSRQTQAVSTSPSGAIVFSPFLGTDPNALYLEMYSDGMFYHEAVSSLDVNRVWGAIVTHAVDGSGNFTSQLRCYFIAMNDAQDSWLVYRLDMPTAGWQPGPETLAATSGLRTTMLSPRSPDVSVQATQVRLNAQGSSENYFTLYLEMDDGEQIKLGDLQSVSLQSSAVPYAFDIPSQVKPGRRLALA